MVIVIPNSAVYVIIGVALVGYYTGVAVIFIFTYMAEVSLDNQRKVMSGGFGFSIRIGLFIVYFAGIWLSFRWFAVFGLFQVCLYCLSIVINPLSPVWYVKQSLDDKAKSILLYLHGSEFVADTEIQKIKGKTLTVLKELGGHEAMVSFSSHILENQQVMGPKVVSLFYPIFLIIGATVCILIMNCCKLKLLLIIASVLPATSHISMAIYYLLSEHYLYCNTEYSQLCHTLAFWPIFTIALFSLSYGFGWGLVFYSLMRMMFTVHKEFSLSISGIFTNISAFFVVFIFFYLLHNIGGFFTFLIFAINYLFACIYVYFFIDI
ncbi:hypothetical protein LOD99_5824 [Oopsacas minuta]|uniref:Uncharacterized protein n=1 Tax=Oopsacas minuta TaxID=111878 RepID=A0AAV7JN38_9METZ|nr:hypothetical protein LOD99_5824 [Oopsacas minuta]